MAEISQEVIHSRSFRDAPASFSGPLLMDQQVFETEDEGHGRLEVWIVLRKQFWEGRFVVIIQCGRKSCFHAVVEECDAPAGRYVRMLLSLLF